MPRTSGLDNHSGPCAMLRASAVLPPDTNRLAELRFCLRNRLPTPGVGQYTCIDCLRIV